MRSKKAVINTTISLLFEIVNIISAFLLPRLVINTFGSGTNGVTQAVSQFIGYISLLAAGVGAVTVAALYKPLSYYNYEKISSIVNATVIFLKKISRIFIVAVIGFAIIFPFFVIEEFEYWYSFSLVLILCIGTLGNYYFGLAYRMVLNADQKQYINNLNQLSVLILHTTVAVILINNGTSIHVVKLASSLIFLINPIFVFYYVRKKYKIDKTVEADFSAINQRWDAFAHQIADFVNSNTDLLILVILTNSKEVSVYTVYYLVYNGLRVLVNSMITGVTAAFGNMIAKGERKTVKKNLKVYEFLLHSISVVLYVSMSLLISSFVYLYVKGVTDVNYYRPVFGYIISITGFFVAVRIPYQAVVRAAGHFKQTRNGAFIEAILNIIISLALVIPFGMVGLAIGSLVAAIFRTIQYGIYSSKHIVDRSIWEIVRRFIVSIVNVLTILVIIYFIPLIEVKNFLDWAINGFIITGIGIVVTLLFSIVFYFDDLINMKNIISRVFNRNKTLKIIKKN